MRSKAEVQTGGAPGKGRVCIDARFADRLGLMVDMVRQEKGIRRGLSLATLLTLAAFALAFIGLPHIFTFPEALDARLAFALKAALFIVVVLAAAVGMVSTARRASPEDIGGAAAGPPGPRLALKAAFLQNTLEQSVIATLALFGYAALVSGPWLTLIPAAVLTFIAGRILFYRGYPGGAAARSLGMGLTMMPFLLLLLAGVGMVMAEIAGLR